jgi:hypothetical protein
MAVPARPVECVEKWAEETPGLFSNSIRGIPLRLRIVNVGYEKENPALHVVD